MSKIQSSPPISWLKFENISKSFGKNLANDGVSFSIQLGTIHALIGENGAGKSTTMKILFGLYQRDSGQIYLNDKPISFRSPLEAKLHGFGMVHQHFMLAGTMNALDHFFLDEKIDHRGFWKSFGPFLKKLSRNHLRKEMNALSQKFQMPVPWDIPVQELSVGFRQRIEILKILRNQADILILDEPTAVLTPQESEALFSQLRELKKSGKTIIIITHKLKEVMALADDVTVFRRGKIVAHRKISETNSIELTELMVGKKMPTETIQTPATHQEIIPRPILQIQDLTVRVDPTRSPLQNIHFTLRSGEILGLAGIEGHGQSELIQVLLNPRKFQGKIQGDILWNKKSVIRETSQYLKSLGLSYFPEDRLEQGALIDSSMAENFILGLQRSPFFNSKGWLKSSQIYQTTEQEMKHFDVRPVLPKASFRTYSGGNQQKFVVARELFRQPKILIAAQPTRGVDIGAIERIHAEILELRKKNSAILLISSDLDELLKLSDRIMVFFEGKIVGELPRHQFDERVLGQWMLKGQLGGPL